MATPSVIWTVEDDIRTAREGWCIGEDNRSSGTITSVMCFNAASDAQEMYNFAKCPPQLDGDGHAWRIIKRGMQSGDLFYVRAFASVHITNQVEILNAFY